MAKRGRRPGTFQEPKQERTRQQLARIMEVANDLFAQNGFESTKLADIAGAVPCSMSTIYDRFASKDELLRYMHQRGVEETLALIDRIQPPSPGSVDLRTMMPAAISAGLDTMQRYRGVHRAVLERVTNDPELEAQELELQEGLARAVVRLISAFQDQFTHPNPELAVRYVERLMRALMEQHGGVAPAPSTTHISDEQFRQETTRVVLAYLGIHLE